MSIPPHPNKDIKKAIDEAILYKWIFEKLGKGGHSHVWGQITCPAKTGGLPYKEWCKMLIYTTPQNPSNIAQTILRKIKKCIH